MYLSSGSNVLAIFTIFLALELKLLSLTPDFGKADFDDSPTESDETAYESLIPSRTFATCLSSLVL